MFELGLVQSPEFWRVTPLTLLLVKEVAIVWALVTVHARGRVFEASVEFGLGVTLAAAHVLVGTLEG